MILYVSTDSREARQLVGHFGRFEYADINIKSGESLKRRVGFNPMCSIDLNGQAVNLGKVLGRFREENLYFTADKDGNIEKYSVPERHVVETETWHFQPRAKTI